MIERLNNSVNIIAFMIVVTSLGFVALHQESIARDLVVGAIGLMGGKALSHSATSGNDTTSTTTSTVSSVPKESEKTDVKP